MFKKILSGMLFGFGFGLAFVLMIVVYFRYFFQATVQAGIDNEIVTTVRVPPDVRKPKQFLGSVAIFSGDFAERKRGVLAGGPGEIVGKVTANHHPVSGLKLRLALNESVLSQWATTNSDGTYVVKVPYGTYKIYGYELDSDSANAVLSGKIRHPQSIYYSESFEVSDKNKGHGITFRFIDPVDKSGNKQKYSLSEDIVLHWAPYPDAVKYVIQIYEKSEPYAFAGNRSLFDWSSRPQVSETSFNLKEHGVALKAGGFYVIEIEALDSSGVVVSTTDRMRFVGYDFEITD